MSLKPNKPSHVAFHSTLGYIAVLLVNDIIALVVLIYKGKKQSRSALIVSEIPVIFASYIAQRTAPTFSSHNYCVTELISSHDAWDIQKQFIDVTPVVKR